jgi:hypothetical protein
MDESSVEEAIKNRLIVDEKLLKKLAKTITVPSVSQVEDKQPESISPTSSRETVSPYIFDSSSETKINLCNELKEHSSRLLHQSNVAMDDIYFYRQGTITIQSENSHYLESIKELHSSISAEQAHLHHHQFLDSLCKQIMRMPNKTNLLEELEGHRNEVEKLCDTVDEERKRLNDLREKLDKFIHSFELNTKF